MLTCLGDVCESKRWKLISLNDDEKKRLSYIIERLRQRLDYKRNKTGGYFTFGSYSWYVLNPKQIRNTEGMLIRLCGTPYNIIKDERDDT
jgi:hypothetical protein